MTYDDRDTVCQKGKFRLEEWEDVNYCEHCFYNGDEPLEDEKVVILLSDLTAENEQLKQTMKEVAELLSDEVDLFSDEAIEHDINAYMELKELDNKDAFYMAKATKTAIKMLKGDDGNA